MTRVNFEIQYAMVFETDAWEIVSLAGSVGTWQAPDGTRRVGVYSAALRRRAPAHALAAAAVACAGALLLLAAALLPPSARPPLCACAAFTSCLWSVSECGGRCNQHRTGRHECTRRRRVADLRSLTVEVNVSRMVSALLRLPSGGGAPRCVSLMGALCACAALAALAAAVVQRLARCANPPPRLVRTAVSAASAFCRLTPLEVRTFRIMGIDALLNRG